MPASTAHDARVRRSTDEEIKLLNKTFVNRVYTLLWLKTHEPETYKAFVELGAMFASGWDEPEFDFKF